MNLISQLKKIEPKISSKILFNESLSKHSWFKLGGDAKAIFKPKNLSELSIFLKNLDGFEKIKVLGEGSNTIVRDGGFDGVIIKLGKSFSHVSLINKNMLITGASAYDKLISNFAYENSLSGFEFLSCIPGTIAGCIRMNSCCYGEDVSKILVSVQAMDLTGNFRVIYASDIKFHYRGSNLDNNLILVSATFKGKKDKKNKIKNKTLSLIEKKKKDQPSHVKTCGSTFKNPKNKKAWSLIKDSGCAGMKVGDAYISAKHCNFFINKGNAKSSELENLINIVKKKVFKKTGVKLELELEIIGKKP